MSGKAPCYKKVLNKCFIVENTSMETALTMFDEILLYSENLLDFKWENSLCSLSISITGPSCFKKFFFIALNVSH